ncbi:hypothetical protein HNY73_019206 [Argiope bruennichi]|uniref:Uncharacterized protein n=1 Tax=Argiope bruennichi TaxID=94029 RepID=A0A8T0EFP4_ARGBR|nr:hypothetical protein HNY73_019206 [Argiope bruennichi]
MGQSKGRGGRVCEPTGNATPKDKTECWQWERGGEGRKKSIITRMERREDLEASRVWVSKGLTHCVKETAARREQMTKSINKMGEQRQVGNEKEECGKKDEGAPHRGGREDQRCGQDKKERMGGEGKKKGMNDMTGKIKDMRIY